MSQVDDEAFEAGSDKTRSTAAPTALFLSPTIRLTASMSTATPLFDTAAAMDDNALRVDRVFLLLGNPGIISGVYDPCEPSRIRWDRHEETILL